MVSRFVEWKGKLWERSFFDPPLDLQPGACPRCGGLGVVPEEIDEERYDLAFPCPECRIFCGACNDWVKREGHTHVADSSRTAS